MSDQNKEKVIHAIINREYQRTDRLMNSFLSRANMPPDVQFLMQFGKEWMFQRVFPTLCKDILEDSVGAYALSTRISRLLSLAQYLGGDRLLKSDLGDLLRARLSFLDKGVELPKSYDAAGNPVKITLRGTVEDLVDITEDLAGFLKVTAKYISGFAEAYEHRPELMALDDMVEEREVEMYALLKAFANGKPIGGEDLLERYHRFTHRFVTNGEPGEYSFLLKKPFDLLIQLGRYAFELVGNEDSWMGIIEFATTTPQTKSLVMGVFEKTGVTKEVQSLIYQNKDAALNPLVETLTGLKEVSDFVGSEIYRMQTGVIDQFTGVKDQRELLLKYGKLRDI